jgi:hypothetical protein
MSLLFVEGPAGCGKTTRIFQELAKAIEERPIVDHERVLALTKMHGSRRRMQGRLLSIPGLRRRFECITIDSLAWRIYRRWRSLVRTMGNQIHTDNDYKGVCSSAGDILTNIIANKWIARSFPMVVVDEMQDSKDGQLKIIRALSESTICIAAADDYQDLESTGENVAVSWAHDKGNIITLAENYRTGVVGLIAASNAIRNGQPIPMNGKGFNILGALNSNVGASFVSKNITWWMKTGDIAIITPVRLENSKFVRDLFMRVKSSPIGKEAFGPYVIPWEVSQEEQCEQFLCELNLPGEALSEVSITALRIPEQRCISVALNIWLEQQRRIAGRNTITVGELHRQIRVIHQRSRAYRRVRDKGVRAMTVHQAKNREFESVIVLWPYEVAGTLDHQRRLLYNAITRARRQALVVVQNPDRCNKPPFVVA